MNNNKVIIDYTKERWLCGNNDEMVDYIIGECSKLAQTEYKSRHDLVEKVIHLELCKRLKFCQCWQMASAQTRICPMKWDLNIS